MTHCLLLLNTLLLTLNLAFFDLLTRLLRALSRVCSYMYCFGNVTEWTGASSMFYLHTYFYIYPPDLQESDWGSIRGASNYPSLLPKSQDIAVRLSIERASTPGETQTGLKPKVYPFTTADFLPYYFVPPGSDAGSDVVKPSSSFVIQNRQTSCSMWCPM